MNPSRLLLVGVAMSLLTLPIHAVEAEPKLDPSIECGAVFTVLARQSENPEDAAIFTNMGNLLFNGADTRLASMGVSLEERERIGLEAVTTVSERMDSGNIGVTFADCHTAMELGIESAMPNVVTPNARELLTCGSQFMHAIQSSDQAEPNPDFQTAADDQMQRAQAELEKAGVTGEEQDHLAELFGLSVGMVLGMGEEPIIAWERCGAL